MKSYIIPQKRAELDWSKVPAAAIDCCPWDYSAEVSAKAQLCYDAQAIYVRLSTVEAHIRAEENGPVGRPCEDSCLEFFFCPNPYNDTYFNIEFNPNCCLHLGIGTSRYDSIRLLLPDENPLGARATRTADGWEVEYTIPAAFIQRFIPEFKAESGTMMRGNFYKCGDKTVKEHYYAWNPVECPEPDFHRPEYFGKLYFE